MTRLDITKRYHFEAAHWLPNVRDGHRCKRCHGHNYEIEVCVTGPLDPAGFIIDFWDLDDIVQPLIEIVDHRTLNDIQGLENPTAELIAEWFLAQITNRLRKAEGFTFQVRSIRVFETKDCWATVTT